MIFARSAYRLFSRWRVAPTCAARRVMRLLRNGGQDHEIALMHQLGFTHNPPKIDGIRKVLIALNLKAFGEALTLWAETPVSRRIVAELSPPRAFAGRTWYLQKVNGPAVL